MSALVNRYCQAIRQQNVEKRLEFAREILRNIQNGNNFPFDNIFFTDESKFQVERYTKKSCRRLGHAKQLKGEKNFDFMFKLFKIFIFQANINTPHRCSFGAAFQCAEERKYTFLLEEWSYRKSTWQQL
jgi:hypothetical protein